MPLLAHVDGGAVIAPFLTDTEWEALRRAVAARTTRAVLPCCGAAARLRRSTLGTRHFHHPVRGDCAWAPEPAQPLRAKAEIALAARAAGFTALPEASGPDWRADVLVTGAGQPVAFEVRWSAQSLAETEARQARYARDGVRGCWFFRRPPAGLKPWAAARPDLPMFTLVGAGDPLAPPAVDFGQEERRPSLAEFVTALLTRRVRFCAALTARRRQHVRVVFVEVGCWRCHRPYHVYALPDYYRSCCGALLHSAGDPLDPQVVAAALAFLRSPAGRGLRVGAITPRSSETGREPFLSFGCPWCDALYEDHSLHEAVVEARYALEHGTGVSRRLRDGRDHSATRA